MKKIIEKQREYLTMIKECYDLKSRMALLISFFQVPLRYFYKLTGFKFKHKFIFNVTLKNKNGIFFCGKERGYARITCTFFERNLQRYFKLDKGVFIDIGANCGKYTIGIARELGDLGNVIAIEPERKNFKFLLKNIRLNNLKNVYPMKLACLDRSSELKLYLSDPDNDVGGHSINAFCESENLGPNETYFDGRFENVKGEKLDVLFDNLGIGKGVSLIKIDVEGAEIEVLRGSVKILKRFHPKIIIETCESHLRNIKKILAPYNYKIVQISGDYYFAE